MKKFLILCALLTGVMTGEAQTVIDNFIVGPYVVDYSGQGDVKYRLRDNINLYEFFELQKDTIVVAPAVTETPVNHAIQISGYLGTNRHAPFEIGVSGVWKQKIIKSLYFNGGISFGFDYADSSRAGKRNMLEIGVPLQIEWGKLNRQKASLYALAGFTPTVYSTLMAKEWNGSSKKYVDAKKELKKSGLMIAPVLEIGANIPMGKVIARIGVYGTYKINCTPGDYNVYTQSAGVTFMGAKIGVVL